jgi:transcriptional regulator with XRE-family HTH domain
MQARPRAATFDIFQCVVRENSRKRSVQPHRNKAVAQVRNSANKTQKQFAKDIGIGQSMLQAIEDGTRRLEARQAELIMAYSGADPKSLLEGVKAKTVGGRPYSRNSFTLWRLNEVGETAIEIAAQRASLFAEALIRAAYNDGVRSSNEAPRYRFISTKLSRKLLSLAEQSGLMSSLREQLQKRVLEDRSQELSLAEIKKLVGVKGTGVDVVGFNSLSAGKMSKLGRFKTRIQTRPLLYPFAGVTRAVNLGRMQADALSLDLRTVKVRLPWIGGGTATLHAIVFKSSVTNFKGSRIAEAVIPRTSRNEKLFKTLGAF